MMFFGSIGTRSLASHLAMGLESSACPFIGMDRGTAAFNGMVRFSRPSTITCRIAHAFS
jgi:hypothetical protein